jgi:hypothetical protein
LFVFLLISCTQSKEKKESREEPSCEEENFDQFIHRFSTREAFQLERTKFPVGVINPDAGCEEAPLAAETIGRYDWELLDLTYDSSYLTRPYDQYSQSVRYAKDTAVVEIRGINNGIYADYYFVVIEGKWYLVTLYEASF